MPCYQIYEDVEIWNNKQLRGNLYPNDSQLMPTLEEEHVLLFIGTVLKKAAQALKCFGVLLTSVNCSCVTGKAQ